MMYWYYCYLFIYLFSLTLKYRCDMQQPLMLGSSTGVTLVGNVNAPL